MKRADIGNAKEKVAAYSQGSRNLMKYPEYLFCVFENLVGDDQVYFAVREWQLVALNVGNIDMIGFSGEILRIFLATFHRNPFGLRVKTPNDLKVPTRSSAQIGYNPQVLQPLNEVLHNLWPISLTLIREPSQPV